MGRGKSQRSLELIDAAYTILAEIQPASVRAVCYRLFAAEIINSMAKAETNKVSTQLTWAREQNLIPWSWIVDETREAERVSAWEDPAAYVEAVKRSYRRDRWADQPERIEVWSEKGTIRGTLAPILEDYGITFRVMHGYGSSTAIYQAAQDSLASSKPLTVFYVGDWDPSGLHMSEVDLPWRLREYGGDVHLHRLALTEEDTLAGLPSFAASEKGPKADRKGDSRHLWYVGREAVRLGMDMADSADQRAFAETLRCWELDALSPVVLRDRVEHAILERLDRDAWDRAEVVEAAERDSLSSILNAWPGISGQASKYEGRA